MSPGFLAGTGLTGFSLQATAQDQCARRRRALLGTSWAGDSYSSPRRQVRRELYQKLGADPGRGMHYAHGSQWKEWGRGETLSLPRPPTG